MSKKIEKLFVKTYGCQMNVFDSERIEESLGTLGIQKVNKPQASDLILLNTCHIREKAAEKVYSEIGRLKKIKSKNPGIKIGVIGCVAQAEGQEIMHRAEIVDMVLGPQVYHRLPEIIQRVQDGEKVVDTDFPPEDKFEKLGQNKRKKRSASSFLTVQEGCDKFCSFCVVPYTRGGEVSRNPEVIVKEANDLVASGVKEITLLGQNVNAYLAKNNAGLDLGLAGLIKKICVISDLKRLRFITSHPRDMTNNLIDLFGEEEKLMPYLHLPIQSGSDKILKRMNRGHTVKSYVETINRLRKVRPDVAISGDFIVGFPGETEDDFACTLDLLDEIKYAQAYSFKYSPRPGTPAYERDDLPEKIKSDRLKRLQVEIQLFQRAFQDNLIETVQEILVEKYGKFSNQFVGRSPYMNPVVINSKKDIIGEIKKVRIVSSSGLSLVGELVS
jgi:tRNA-2-methylthio-N6-dimethylallyladenosine synthase